MIQAPDFATSGFTAEANGTGASSSLPPPLAKIIKDHDGLGVIEAGTDSWQSISARKQSERDALLRPDSRIQRSADLNVSTLPETSGILTSRELEIVNLTATALAASIADRRYTASEVSVAYCKAATIAQDATNCLTEICFEAALLRAKELDEILEQTGKTVGPLHGVPVSVKDHIDVAGLDASTGYVGWCYGKIAEKDAVIVRCVREAGGVIYCKTANPQSLLAIETNNNVYGRTVNPFNTNLSAGGSSGGEGALVAMRGSPLGIGTDIAGSIRIPALWNGIYGLRPSVARMPHTGMQGPHEGMDTIMGVMGPMARSMLDLDLFCRSINGCNPWYYEAQQISKEWRPLNLDTTRKLTIAVMRDDGMVLSHPPVLAALDRAVAQLKDAGHEIVEWLPNRAAECEELLFTLCLQDRGEEYRQHCAMSGEPLIPGVEWLLSEKAPKENVQHPYELWKLVRTREILRQQGVDQWTAYPKLDAILCPGAPTLAPPHNTSRHWGYTSMFNVLDWPGVTFPVNKPTEEEMSRAEAEWRDRNVRSEVEKYVHDTWSREVFAGAPVGLQLVGRRLEEEKLLEDAWLVERALKQQ